MARLARDTTAAQKLQALERPSPRLQRDFGRWQVPWGEINRFQRISPRSSRRSATPRRASRCRSPRAVGARSRRSAPRRSRDQALVRQLRQQLRRGGRIRAAGARPGRHRRRRKRRSRLRRISTTRRQRYASGNLREVYFYPDQLSGHTERVYHPGETSTAPRQPSEGGKLQTPANLSVARIRPSRTPGSLNRCPPSGMMLSSTSGHACLQLPRGHRRGAGVVAALDDDSRECRAASPRPRAAGLPRASRCWPCSGSRSARPRPPLSGSVKCSIVSGLGSRVTMSPSHLLHALAARSCSSLSSLVSRLR